MTPPVTVMAFVVGPIDPATNRGFAAVENSSAACRASFAGSQVQLVRVGPARPYSARDHGVPPNVLVSTISAPASKYAR